ncbi:MAG: hypothetical protein ABUL48_02420, partial [Pseudorhodoplanes sp.]
LCAAALAAFLSAPAQAECTCRAQGRLFEQGQAVCLSTPNGLRIATCGMVLNNSAWEFSQTPCVSSQRLPQRRPAVAHDHQAQDKS